MAKPAFLLVLALAVTLRASLAAAALSPEAERAEGAAKLAEERAERFTKLGLPIQATLARDLALARHAEAGALQKAWQNEIDAHAAEEAEVRELREGDASAAAREERRQRLARLADQLVQARRDLDTPPLVSMPKGRNRTWAKAAGASSKGREKP